jgi:hypothetical protein
MSLLLRDIGSVQKPRADLLIVAVSSLQVDVIPNTAGAPSVSP